MKAQLLCNKAEESLGTRLDKRLVCISLQLETEGLGKAQHSDSYWWKCLLESQQKFGI